MSDEKWINGETGEAYWRPSTLGDEGWVVIQGQVPPTPPPQARHDPEPVQVAPVEPTPIPLTPAGRLRALIEAVRSGDRSAVDALREALGGTSDDAA